ncbi:hypothetical protein ZIOFF_002224 [Zingiber officinale]|uniref:RRM domain-containing protein n=1 Tax=Zingiber officinale TaxID=94328 RepID=A0A8J5HWK3_ZINOF|nr:hypothetical protein ZIOFF_002224 [Zingiber officinale]
METVHVIGHLILLMQVHFAATREALFSHFTKCGPIVKVTLLTDVLTGHPKGEADIIFANKESVDKAILLSGTSFFSRILVVCNTEIRNGLRISINSACCKGSTVMLSSVSEGCVPSTLCIYSLPVETGVSKSSVFGECMANSSDPRRCIQAPRWSSESRVKEKAARVTKNPVEAYL